MNGVQFLEQAIELYPEAKRVLLTAYADTDAAIKAINEVQIDHYLLKPWDPPEEKLYPVLTDLLDDWHSAYRPPYEGIRVVGHRWSPDSHRVKDFLASNNIPYLWLDIETSDEAKLLLQNSKIPGSELPVLFLTDGSTLSNPDTRAIAESVGLQTLADSPLYDLVVVGAGPGGLGAAMYGASEGLRTIAVEQRAPGGQAGTSSRIENYLGFPGGISGAELARRAVTQAKRFGVEILSAQQAVGLDVDGPTKTLKLGDGTIVNGRAILIATGVSYRRLDAKGIEGLTGSGIYYGAAMTEGETVRGEDIYIIGGANSAGQAAMYFSAFAKNVIMLVRGQSLSKTMSQYLIDQIAGTENIQVWTQSQVQEAIGNGRLQQLVLTRDTGKNTETVDAAALFIFIGAVPHTDWLGDQIARDEHGFVLTGPDAILRGATMRGSLASRMPFMLETNVSGVFVAGDVRSGSVKRVASAVGEGSMAVMYVHRYLDST